MEWGAPAAEEQSYPGRVGFHFGGARLGGRHQIRAGEWGMGERSWVKEIGKQLREEMGDCPTLPEEMRDLVRKLDSLEGQRTAGRENAVEHNFGVRRARGSSAPDAGDH
jgi:hypothetical protein